MIYTVPHYYTQFRCIAGECTDTCCAGWQIVIDERTLGKYKSDKSPFGRRLRRFIDWRACSFRQNEHRCAFLNEENLCDIYTEAGPEMLCKTCRNYPRKIEEYEGSREISLELSCVEAAKLILGCTEPVRFVTKEDDRDEEYEEFDFFLYTKLMDVRDAALRIMQNRNIDCRERMAMVLALAHDVQRRISDGKLFEVDGLLERYQRDGATDRFREKLAGYRIEETERYHIMKQMFSLFAELEPLKKDWPEYVKKLDCALYGGGAQKYAEERQRFQRVAGYEQKTDNSGDVVRWSIWCEQLMVYFVFGYFCGAVYDEQAYGRMKMAVVSTLLIQEMAQGLWKLQHETFGFEDMLEIAHRYAKEVEHSDLNLETMQKRFRKNKEFGLEALLSAVLS